MDVYDYYLIKDDNWIMFNIFYDVMEKHADKMRNLGMEVINDNFGNPTFHFRNLEIYFKNNNIDVIDQVRQYFYFDCLDISLPMAALYSNEHTINYLLSQGGNPTLYYYRSVRIACTRSDNPAILATILEYKLNHAININYRKGLLMAQAVVSNNIPGIKILLEHGFDMESHGNKFLYLALKKEAYESFNYLVKDLDSFVENLIKDHFSLVSKFTQYVKEYGIELHPESLQKLIQKN
jgi:hypothetical protein